MIISLYTDGGSKGNPGPSAIGGVASADGKELFRFRKDIGNATNNIAEYSALIEGLKMIHSLIQEKPAGTPSVERINTYSDSELMVKQLNGLYKIKQDHLRKLLFQVRVCESELGIPVHFHHILREKNKIADALVNNKAS